MSATGTEIELATLQRRAEQAIRSSRPREHIVRLLEEILARAAEDSEASRFAHRHLAELRLEESPWSAALHLRRVLAMSPDDDAAHALMGLCQALQGNFRAAVAAFRRAVSLAPTNPWYNHNLGHLLDVALGMPAEALGYLRKAHRADPVQEEVGASLVHCLGRLGACDEALGITKALLKRHPRHDDLQRLHRWLEQGAPPKPDGKLPRPAPRPGASLHAVPSPASPRAAPRDADENPADERSLTSMLKRAGATEGEIRRALRIWRDFAAGAVRARMCAVTAAAIDYAIARMDGETARQREVAERHGVPARDLGRRFRELKGALQLSARDQRYL